MSTNGMPDADPGARGEGGMFATVLSAPLEIIIEDPCKRSVVNYDGGLVVEELRVPLGDELLNLDYTGPSDSVSAKYGNGYDKCGSLTYEWLNDAGQAFSNENFSSKYINIINSADAFSYELKSSQAGTMLVDQVTLAISLA